MYKNFIIGHQLCEAMLQVLRKKYSEEGVREVGKISFTDMLFLSKIK